MERRLPDPTPLRGGYVGYLRPKPNALHPPSLQMPVGLRLPPLLRPLLLPPPPLLPLLLLLPPPLLPPLPFLAAWRRSPRLR